MKKGPGKLEFLFLIGVASLALIAPKCFASEDESAKSILFLGDSLTAGYGIEVDQAYPALIQKKIREAGLEWSVIPSGLSGETTAGGLRRIDWVMRQPIDVLVLALGANDGLRGIDLKDTMRNLQGIIDKARNRNPDVQIMIAGMKMPPNLGKDYMEAFERIYPKIAESNDALLIPFLLEGVGGEESLNLADGIHPNPKGHEIIAETVWKALEPLVRGE